LKIRITFATKDSTAGKTLLVNCTFAACVVGTSATRHWLDISGTQLCSQVHQFRRGHKQTVVELSEITTSAAGLAQTGRIAKFMNFQIQPIVDFSYSF
jgi:hypothetical protein